MFQVIPKQAMQHGWCYVGDCRNARVAVWDGGRKEFVILQREMGDIAEYRLPHVDDDPEGKFDVFEPYWPLQDVVEVYRALKVIELQGLKEDYDTVIEEDDNGSSVPE
jgi:hypothetical protein